MVLVPGFDPITKRSDTTRSPSSGGIGAQPGYVASKALGQHLELPLTSGCRTPIGRAQRSA